MSYCLRFVLILLIFKGYSQVGINTDNPEVTLDVRAQNHLGEVSATDGILVPRVNSLGVNATYDGQLVFLTQDDTTNGYTKGFHYWDTNTWRSIVNKVDNTINSFERYVKLEFNGSTINIGSSSASINILESRGVSTVSTSVPNDEATSFSVTFSSNMPNNNYMVFINNVGSVTNELNNDMGIPIIDNKTSSGFDISIEDFYRNSQSIETVEIMALSLADSNTLARNNDLGIFESDAALNSAYPSPFESDRTLIKNSTAFAGINGITVTAGFDFYNAVYNGSTWEIVGWYNENTGATAGPWIDLGAVQFASTGVTQPSKPTTVDKDYFRYRSLGNNYIEIDAIVAFSNIAGVVEGQGDLLLDLSSYGLQLDLTEHPIYTGTGVASNSLLLSFNTSFSNQSTISQNGAYSRIFPIPYSINQLRLYMFDGNFANAWVSQTLYNIGGSNNKVFRFNFTVKIL